MPEITCGLLITGPSSEPALIVLDREECVAYVSAGIENLVGYTSAECNALQLNFLFAADSLETHTALLKQCRNGAETRRELWIQPKHNNPFPAQITYFSLESRPFEPELWDRTWMDSVAEAIVAVDDSGHIVWGNPKASSMFGYARNELVGRNIEDLVPRKYRNAHQTHRQSFSQDPTQRPMGQGMDVVALRRTGDEFPVEVSLSYIRQQGRIIALAFISDISERKRTEVKLQQSDEMHRRLFWESPQPLFVYDPLTLRFLMVNQAAAEFLGYTKDELTQMTLDDIRPPGETPRTADVVPRLPSFRAKLTWKVRRKDGVQLHVESFGNTIDLGGAMARLVLLNDVTNRIALENDLVATRDQYQSLAARIIQMQEEERKHLSREIHDSLGQELAALRYQLQALSRTLGQDDHGLHSAVTTCNTLLIRLREIASHLRPPVLDHLNAAEAVEWLVDQFARRTSIVLHKEIPLECPPAPEDVRLAIFRVCQESLTNILRHSMAQNASVKVTIGDPFELRIADDGSGFESSTMRTQSLGLLGMRERSELIGGTLDIESSPGNGTTVIFRLPGRLFSRTQ
ncbi:MAG: PAS domain S-box protein [Bryobacteraceae bacterium]